MALIHASISKNHYRTILNNELHEVIADEPLSMGGSNLGMSPSEILASSLGACTCITLRMYADRKKWALESIKVDIHFEWDEEKNISSFDRKIELIGSLSMAEKERMLIIANKCFVHKILTHPIDIKTEIR